MCRVAHLSKTMRTTNDTDPPDLCKHCSSPLPATKTALQVFCNIDCRDAASKEQRQAERQPRKVLECWRCGDVAMPGRVVCERCKPPRLEPTPSYSYALSHPNSILARALSRGDKATVQMIRQGAKADSEPKRGFQQ